MKAWHPCLSAAGVWASMSICCWSLGSASSLGRRADTWKSSIQVYLLLGSGRGKSGQVQASGLTARNYRIRVYLLLASQGKCVDICKSWNPRPSNNDILRTFPHPAADVWGTRAVDNPWKKSMADPPLIISMVEHPGYRWTIPALMGNNRHY